MYRRYRKIPVIPAHDEVRAVGDMREAELDYLMNTTPSENLAKENWWEKDEEFIKFVTERCNCPECREGKE